MPDIVKNVLISLIIILISNRAQAQFKVSFGIRAGWNSSNISNTDDVYTHSFYYGIHADMHFTDKYTLQPEINFTNQNIALFYPIEDFNQETKLFIISNALINKLYISNKVHFIIGPFFSFKLYDNWNNFNEDEEYEFEDILLYFDTGIIVGIGVDITPDLRIEGRYKQGLIDMYEWWYDQQTIDNHLNQMFQLGLSYKFDF